MSQTGKQLTLQCNMCTIGKKHASFGNRWQTDQRQGEKDGGSW